MELGIRRTAATAAVATDVLARPDAGVLGLVGAGKQGFAHVWAVAAVRGLRLVKLYRRDPRACREAARRVEDQFQVEAVACASAEAAVARVDLVTLATTSAVPVVDLASIAPGTHVTTVGPKLLGGHELPVDVAERAVVIACDSPEQMTAYSEPFFLDRPPAAGRVADLATLVTGERPGRRSDAEISLFCSVGLAGTEPALAAALIDWVDRRERARSSRTT